MHFQRVAVDHAGLSDKLIGQRHARHNGENQCDRGSTHSDDLVAIANLADWISASSEVVSALAGSLAAREMKLHAAQPASFDASPEQKCVHLPSGFINLPDAVIPYNVAGRVKWQAVQLAKRVNFVPARPLGWGKALQRSLTTMIIGMIIMVVPAKARSDWVESPSRFSSLFEHDLFGKPLHTFPDHALGRLLPVPQGSGFLCARHQELRKRLGHIRQGTRVDRDLPGERRPLILLAGVLGEGRGECVPAVRSESRSCGARMSP
ncbi:hypothetical protein [Bradyrhizobium sp. JR3.5]